MNLTQRIYSQKGNIKISFIYFGASLISALVHLVIFPIQSQYLSHTDYAIIGYFSSFNQIITPILNFSLVTYYARRYFFIPEDKRKYVLNAILVTLLAYSSIALLGVLAFFYLYLDISKSEFPFWPYALLSFLPLYFTNFYTLYQVRCRMNKEANKFFNITVFYSILTAVFSIVFVVMMKGGAIGKMWALIIPAVVVAMISFYRLADVKLMRFDWTIVKEAVHFGWPLSLSTMMWYFCGGVDRAMLEPLGDNINMGLYNIGLQISGYMFMFYTVLAQTYEPDIYKSIAEDNKKKLLKYVSLIFFTNMAINLLFICICPFVIDILTAHRYGDASSFARITTLKNITNALYFIVNTIIIGYGFTKSSLGIRVISAVLCFFMYKVMIGNWGFYGAAWGQVFSFLIMTLVAICFLLLVYKMGKLKQYVKH